MMTIWLLNHNLTDFNYLSLHDQRSGTYPRHDGAPELETWNPQEVWYHPADFKREKGIPNFPSWSSSTPVWDAKSQHLMRNLIDESVEFLPLVSPSITDTAYEVINPLRILDCLDYEQSEFAHYEWNKKISDIIKYEFHPRRIGETPIFILPKFKRTKRFVTGEFKQLVEDNNLTGLGFKKVWEG